MTPIFLHREFFFNDYNDEYISIFDRKINPTVSQSISEEQLLCIQNDLQHMNALLKDVDRDAINKIFRVSWEKEKTKDPPDFNRVNDYVWRNIDNSFWCLPIDYELIPQIDDLTRDTLDSFIALKNVCEANGVQLIVSLVPDSYVISSRVINKDFREIPDIQSATYVYSLSGVGVETIYPSDKIVRCFNRYPFAFFYPDNNHPADTTQDVLSDLISERIKRYHLPQTYSPHLFSETKQEHQFSSLLQYSYPKQCDIGDNIPGSAWYCKEILYDGKPVPKVDNSPIMVIGNSFMQFPARKTTTETLPSLLAYKTLSSCNWHRIYANGVLVDFPIRLFNNPEEFLSKTKVLVIYVGTETLKQVNQNNLMPNIRQLDICRLFLNNKKCIVSVDSFSHDDSTDIQLEDDSMDSLPNRKLFAINESSASIVDSISIDNDLVDSSKKMIVVIPACCYRGMSCDLEVNGQKQTVCSYFTNARYNNCIFELPSDTRNITIIAKGSSGTVFAIKDIQIWQ